MSLKIHGVKELRRNVKMLRSKVAPRAYRRAMIKMLVEVEGESMRRNPVDTGFLRGSAGGNSTVIEANERGAKGVVFYTANYAVYVHERTELRHINGEAKFLQNAIASKMRFLKNTVAGSLKVDLFGNKSVGVSPV